MHWLKKVAGITVGVAVGLLVVNLVTRNFAPTLRGWFGLA